MTETSACKRNLEVEIPAGEVEREYTRIAQGFQKKAKIPGFRPGKAPLSLVRQHFGTKIKEETIETLVPAHLRAAFERASLDPVSTPVLDKLNYVPGEPIKFSASFEVIPSFELGDYRAIRAELPPASVAAHEVEDAIDALRQRKSTHEPSQATVAADGLIADVSATGEGSEAHSLAIEVAGKETMPEFTAALRGMTIGEERDLEVTYPADYPNSRMAGTTQKYHLRLNGIQQKVVPEITDAFVKEATGAETVADLRARIGDNIRNEREHEARHKAEESIIDQLLGQSDFPVPDSLVEKQVDAKLERNIRELADQGIDPSKLKVDWSKLRAKHEESARREVRASLLLEKIAAAENIDATPEAVDAEVERAAIELKQPVDALRARLVENGVLDRIKNKIRQEKVLDFLIKNATAGA
jgi:trigger factor